MSVAHHRADPWTRTRTLGGLPADEVRSSLQKAVRRGLLEEAVLFAYELYRTGPEAEDLLWRRIEIMAAEDVGLGDPSLPAVVEALQVQRTRCPRGGERWLYAAHAVRLLATAVKDRTSAELATWASVIVESGARPVEIMDVAVDMHTRRGQEMGRGFEHFFTEGNVVEPELEGRDTTWLEAIRDLLVDDAGRAEP